MEKTRESSEYSINIIHLARLLIKNLKWLAVASFVVMVIVAVMMLLTPNSYTSRATILPSGKSDNLSALRMLTGIGGVAFDVDEQSSALFPEIVQSNQVRDAVLDKTYTFYDDDELKSLTLGEYFGQDNPDLLRLALTSITGIDVSKQTAVITLTVETIYPGLSQKILQQTIKELENYNLNIRKSKAKENVKYLARELESREQELKSAEQELEDFQKSNRDWMTSTDPEILMSTARLKRNIEIHGQTYSLLREQYELARLNEQKDVPIVQVLDSPSYPYVKSWPPRTLTTLMAGFLTFVLGFGLIVIIDIFKISGRSDDSDTINSLGNDIIKEFPVVNRILEKRRNIRFIKSEPVDKQY